MLRPVPSPGFGRAGLERFPYAPRRRNDREGHAQGRAGRDPSAAVAARTTAWPSWREAPEKLRQAGFLVFGGSIELRPWERQVSQRRAQIRGMYLAQAKLLQTSAEGLDLGAELTIGGIENSLRPPDTELFALARGLRQNALARRSGEAV